MKKIIFFIIISLFFNPVFASSTARMVEKGNKLYQEQKYVDALKLYDQALSDQSDSVIINFNAGTAQYKTHDYQKANASFEKSLITQDKSLEAKANYNLGNSRYMLGVSKENTDLSGAVRLLEGALTNYKRTMELVSKDEDAKNNYKVVEKKLKEFKEKLKQRPQENNNTQKQQEKDKEQSQKQEGDGKQNQKEKQQAENKQKEEAVQEEKKAAGKEGQFKQDEQEKQAAQPLNQIDDSGRALARPEESNGRGRNARESAEAQLGSAEMSKEEAVMLLEGYRQEENAAGILKDDRTGAEEKVLKDW